MFVQLKKLADLQTIPKSHAYVDEVASIRNAAWLLESGDFDYASFAEFCNFLEAIVLYDKLYTCPLSKRSEPPSVLLTSGFVKSLVSEGVLTYLDWPTHLLYQGAPDTRETRDYRKGLRTFGEGKKEGILHIEHIHGVGMAAVHHMHVHPSLSNTKAYIQLLKIPESFDASMALLHAYKAIAKSVGSDIEQAIQARGQTYVPIPPIALEILKRVDRLDEIPEEAFAMRRTFKTTRDAYAEYAKTIMDDAIPINKSLTAQNKLRQVLTELSSRYGCTEERRILEWTSIGELAKAAPELAQGDSTSLVQFLLGKPLEWIRHWISRKRFMQLYRLRGNALRTIGYDQQIQRLWGRSADFAGDPPPVLDENVDYPRGSEWTLYDNDDICLWSWSGKYVGYRKGNHVFSKKAHRHVGRFVENEVYSLDGRYLGEWRFGRLVAVPEHTDRTVSSITRVEAWGGYPVGRNNREARASMQEWQDFPEV